MVSFTLNSGARTVEPAEPNSNAFSSNGRIFNLQYCCGKASSWALRDLKNSFCSACVFIYMKKGRKNYYLQVVDFNGLMQVCHQVTSSLSTSSSCIKSEKIKLDATWYLQTVLVHVVETTCIKLVDKKSWLSTCLYWQLEVDLLLSSRRKQCERILTSSLMTAS